MRLVEIRTVKKRFHACRDATDDPYLWVAARVRARFLITRDQDLLSIDRETLRRVGLRHLEIVEPEDFLFLAPGEGGSIE